MNMEMTPRRSTIVMEEIRDLEKTLAAFPKVAGDDALGQAYRHRLEQLRIEVLLARTSEIPGGDEIVATLRVHGFGDGHRVPATLLGRLVSAWQDLVDALGQAISGNPTSRGRIPTTLRERTQLDVVALVPGSFVIQLAPHLDRSEDMPPDPERELIDSALAAFSDLVAAGVDHDLLEDRLRRLKSRVAGHYAALLETVRSSGFSLQVASRSTGRSTSYSVISLDPGFASALRATLLRLEESVSQEIEFIGVLTGANLRTLQFELDLGEEGIISGRVAADREHLLHAAVIGETYVVTVVERTATQAATGETSVQHELRSIRSASASGA